jgi:hypothetical protein
MTKPRLMIENDKIELDQVSLLVEYIHKAFSAAYGESPDVNDWNAVNIQRELSELFSVTAFNSLFATEFGKGVIVGAWVQEFILSDMLGEQRDRVLEEGL